MERVGARETRPFGVIAHLRVAVRARFEAYHADVVLFGSHLTRASHDALRRRGRVVRFLVLISCRDFFEFPLRAVAFRSLDKFGSVLRGSRGHVADPFVRHPVAGMADARAQKYSSQLGTEC